MNKRCGIALVLLGISGMIVALLHLFNTPEQTARFITACLSVLVMVYGIYLAVWLKFYSVSKHACTKKDGDNTEN
jgi:formate-dependent nitrite reductase membrane component NrfD